MTIARTFLGLMLASALFLIATPALAGGPTLEGKVVGTDGEMETPLENVRINITPLGPIKGKKRAPVDDLVGVATTTPLGKFRIGELSSPSKGEEFALMKNWRYRIEIDAAGHYKFDQEIEVKGRAAQLDFVVKSHSYEIVDDTGVVETTNSTIGGNGQVRWGN